MPLGRQLSKLFNPGPAASYDPNREALFAQLLSSGAAPTNDVGSAIGNLAQFFVGSRGLKKQGQARDIAMDEQAAMEATSKHSRANPWLVCWAVSLEETLTQWMLLPCRETPISWARP